LLYGIGFLIVGVFAFVVIAFAGVLIYLIFSHLHNPDEQNTGIAPLAHRI
jgi:uncharacterized membrane protein